MVLAPGPSLEVTQLLDDPSPRVRSLAARLAGKLGLDFLRPVLQRLCQDPEPVVQEAAEWALAQLVPDGGRGGSIIRPHGGFINLKANMAAEIAYDATVVFCNRFIDRRSRTHDQMVQAARSGRQNIIEGSAAAGTSSKTELKLIGVARASLEELLADYQDYLRQHGLPRWGKDDPRIQEIRQLAYQENRSYDLYRSYFEAPASPETAANTAISLIHQANYLLERLKKQLEQEFIQHGGVSERMTQARLQYRNNPHNS